MMDTNSYQHVLYTAADFTAEEYDRRNLLAVGVIDGALAVCKRCGASEVDLETWVTCRAYRAAQRLERFITELPK